MHCNVNAGQVRRWNEKSKMWFNDKSRDTFLVIGYSTVTGEVTVHEPGFSGTSRYTPEYLSETSHEVKDG